MRNNHKKILCIVAHPDDEALGLGGTLIKHSEQGDEVNIIILSEGEDAKFIKHQLGGMMDIAGGIRFADRMTKGLKK